MIFIAFISARCRKYHPSLVSRLQSIDILNIPHFHTQRLFTPYLHWWQLINQKIQKILNESVNVFHKRYFIATYLYIFIIVSIKSRHQRARELRRPLTLVSRSFGRLSMRRITWLANILAHFFLAKWIYFVGCSEVKWSAGEVKCLDTWNMDVWLKGTVLATVNVLPLTPFQLRWSIICTRLSLIGCFVRFLPFFMCSLCMSPAHVCSMCGFLNYPRTLLARLTYPVVCPCR